LDKKILFISHEATRTGAPLVLLNLLKWLKKNTDISFEVLLKTGGELEPEFAEIAPTSVFYRGGNSLSARVSNYIALKFPYRVIKSAKSDIALIYSNTVINGDLLALFSGTKCPVISHVHELEHAIVQYSWHFERAQKYSQHYICPSVICKKNLIEKHGIPDDKIDVVHSFIPVIPRNPDNDRSFRDKVCGQLGIPAGAAIICACGRVSWCKGPELFIQLARICRKRYPDMPVYFIWAGEMDYRLRRFELQYEIDNLGLEKYVHFIGPQRKAMDYIAICDVLVSTSREDSLGLVCLEAASAGKPSVAFGLPVGAKEFIENDSGYVVPYLDAEEMAEKTVLLVKSPELRDRLGARARIKLNEGFTTEVCAPKILNVIEQVIRAGKNGLTKI